MHDREIIDLFLTLFPEYTDTYKEHISKYDELLQHVFYADVINDPLFELLKKGVDSNKIRKYVDFIELMWSQGDDTVQNVVDVTILERLSDDIDVWQGLGKYISDEFRNYINGVLLKENALMSHVEKI